MTSTLKSVLAGLALAVACHTSAGAQGGGEVALSGAHDQDHRRVRPRRRHRYRRAPDRAENAGELRPERHRGEQTWRQRHDRSGLCRESEPGWLYAAVRRPRPDDGEPSHLFQDALCAEGLRADRDDVEISPYSGCQREAPRRGPERAGRVGEANPDKTNYATASPAFTLASELFKLRSGAPGERFPTRVATSR